MTKEDQALEVVPEHQAALFDTSKPDLVIEKAQGIAVKLTDIVEKANLYSMISGRKYVKCEGWTTMLAMLGVFPHVEYCRRIDDPKAEVGEFICYEARVELRTMDGKAVGSGEAICSAKESNWSRRDEFTIKSMAQTRATGKAARNAFSWIMALAGYEATPSEEMPHDGDSRSLPAASVATAQPKPPKAAKSGPELVTSRFTIEEPTKAKNGNVFWRVLDAQQNRYTIWDSGVCRDLGLAVGEATVQVEREGQYSKIVGVVGSPSDIEEVPF